MSTLISQFIADENGATAVEYGLLASLLGAAIITGLQMFTSGLNGIFELIVASLAKGLENLV